VQNHFRLNCLLLILCLDRNTRSRPLAAAISKRAFQALTLAVACFFAGLRIPASISAYSSTGQFRPAPDRACFVPLGLRDPALPPTRARVTAFGLTKGGCSLSEAVSLPPLPAVAGAGSVCVQLPAAAVADGYYFETGVGGDGDDADPVRWVVKIANGSCCSDCGKACADEDMKNGTNWQTVGASAWELRNTGQLRLYPSLPFPVPKGGGVRVAVTIAPDWEWCIVWLVSQIVQLLCFVALAAAGAAQRECWGRTILAGGYGLTVILIATAAVGYLISGRSREGAQHFLGNVPGAVLSAGVAVAERHLLSVFTVVAVLYCVAQARKVQGSSRRGLSRRS
jgi:hypothetical protein